jgi:molybdopterin-containing oxidoreductase family iron-sulfur binding subunit
MSDSNDKSCHAEAAKPPAGEDALDLAALRARLAASSGPAYWRSLEELAGTPQFEDLLQREFPRHAAEFADTPDGVNRRRFLQLSSASLALAGLTACTRQPIEKMVPYAKMPEGLVPGKPLFYATAAMVGGYGVGVLVESHEGRPTKIEGNPEHPASFGSTDARTQAAILDLYDPDRSQTVVGLGQISTWGDFLKSAGRALAVQQALEGSGLRLLTGTVTSPALAGKIREFLASYPQAQWHQWEAAGRDGARLGARLAFGEMVDTRFDVARADVILSFDSDFLTQGPGAVRYAREFAARRRMLAGSHGMNRFYAAESTPTATGTMADHRLALSPSQIWALALEVTHALGLPGGLAAAPERAAWVAAVAADLRAHPGASLVVAGDEQPAALHALVHAINGALGNTGTTVLHTDPVEPEPVDQVASMQALCADMAGGKVDVLLMFGVNPVYDAPADLAFTAALEKVPLRVHHGLYADETAEYCQWHVPGAHYLETWGDVRAWDGTVTIQQPLIEPLYGGKSALEVISALAGAEASGHDLLLAAWEAQGLTAAVWRRALHDGSVAGSALPTRVPVLVPGAAQAAADLAAARSEGLELCLRPDPSLGDGGAANNGWLQELPKPLSKLVWDNAILLSPRTSERLGLEHGDVVTARAGGRSLEAPVFVLPGQADDAATLHLGFGRRRAGRVGDGVGVNARPLRASSALWTVGGLELAKTGRKAMLVTTQMHQNIEQEGVEAERRHLLRVAPLAAYLANPELIHEMEHQPEDASLYPRWPYEGYAWGMAIDLNACTGCNACVIACQSENTIPVVGKQMVDKGREMHWIRIDRYYHGEIDSPAAYHQPVLCMHCENAPCEVVCPVAATTHSAEGLNDMVYNRCVGTRYCSNNCPYKVRRFNFFNWNKKEPNDAREHPVLELMRNPDVTVRFRGVMEKCTYCVQRINEAKIVSAREDRKVRDGEIVTACQQACPSQAIVFGDINDTAAQVSQWKAEKRNYTLLDGLNTRPRTSYLARLRNPNPALETAAAAPAEGHA